MEAIASQIDSLYVDLRHDTGLRAPDGEGRLTIDVTPAIDPQYDLFHTFFSGDRLSVPSPILLQNPVELSNAEVLRRSIALPLVARVLSEAPTNDLRKCVGQLLDAGFGLWMHWESGEFPSGRLFEEDGVRRQWFGQNPTPRQPIAPTPIVACSWYEVPSSLGPGRYVVTTDTVMDYAVAAYGRRSLALLLKGLRQNESLESLIPTVFGVSAGEFEAGWQEHLSRRYTVQN